MSLWMILLVAGNIAISWGPLQMTDEECSNRASFFTAKVRHAIVDPAQRSPYKGTRPDQVEYQCVRSLGRPKGREA